MHPVLLDAAAGPATLLATLALGFFLGMRHATDADHVVAVTTIVARTRRLTSALWVGAAWGLGHTATILVVGGAIILFGVVIPPRVGLSMELGVALMLVVLGAMNLSGALKRIDEAAHAHGPAEVTPADPVRPRAGIFRRGWRAMFVGVVHGLAGSAAVALLVLATIKSAPQALFYLLIFGVGTVLGMGLLTAAMSVPLAAAAGRFKRVERLMARVTGVVSIVFGLLLGYEITVENGIFSETPTWEPH